MPAYIVEIEALVDVEAESKEAAERYARSHLSPFEADARHMKVQAFGGPRIQHQLSNEKERP